MTETSKPEIDVKDSYVVGFDPGTTTGVVVWSRLTNKVVAQCATSPKDTLEATQALLQDMVYMGVRPVLVAERFDLSPDTLRKSREGIEDAINILGMIWCLAMRWDLELHRVGRSDSKNFVRDEALKKHDLWLNSRHTRDALRVVITWLASTDQDFVRNFWVK